MALHTCMCESCADKISKTRNLRDVSKSFFGTCPMCFLPSKLMRYDIGPTHSELERMRRNAMAAERAKRQASGERGRAERSNTHGKAV